MYRIDRRPETISEIQKYLREVSYALNFTPHVVINGIYGDSTRAAVTAFQRLLRLPPDGDVDRRTWDALYVAYRNSLRGKEPPLLISPDALPISLGSRGTDVGIVKSVLYALSPPVSEQMLPDRARFTRADVYAARNLGRRYGLPPSGVVDASLWKHMTAEYQHQSRHFPLA